MIRLVLALILLTLPAAAAERTITLASTTSTQNSGLYAHILPIFEAETGIRVNVVAVGTGQAIRIAENGDADILIVHHRPSEDAFVAAGHGIDRRDIMVNDFIIVGPSHDPAGVAQAGSGADALARIAAAQAPFVSRGDESGTHLRELELWASLGQTPQGAWYREIGAGMGAALNMAAVTDAYLLTDRGTWLSFGNKRDLALLYQGDPALLNPYGVILVNPARHPHIDAAAARALADWLVSETGQTAIGGFRVNGQILFCPSVIPVSGPCPGG